MVKKDSKILVIIAAVLIVIVGAALVSYAKYKKQEIGVNSNSIQENKDELKGEEGGIPSDFPVYPEAVIESSYSTEGDKKATSVVWKTDANVSEVSAFYKKELENGDWTITSNIENENSNTYSFEKDDKFGFIGIGKGEGGVTIISVTIGLRD